MADYGYMPEQVIGSSKLRAKKGGVTLQFPSDLDIMPYHVQLTFVKYERFRPSDVHTEKTTGTILLPMPSRIPENYHLDYVGARLGWRGVDGMDIAKVKALFEQAGRDLGPSLQNGASVLGSVTNSVLGGEFSNALETLWDATPDKNNAYFALLLSFMPPGMLDTPIGRAIANYTGRVPNPHMTTSFNGVNLRQLQFEWTLSPRSEKESKALRDIVTQIKYFAHPSFDSRIGRFSLLYPDECYFRWVGCEEYLEPIKKCVVTDIVLENAPNGAAFYPGGAPVSMNLNLTFQEVEIRTREDWEGTDNMANGYQGGR